MSYTHWLRRGTCRRLPLLLGMLACVLAPVPAFSGERSPLTLRAGPGTQHTIIATLPPALSSREFTIVAEQGEWAKVRVADGQEGWLRLGALPEGTPTPPASLERSPAPARPVAPPSPPPADRLQEPATARPSAMPPQDITGQMAEPRTALVIGTPPMSGRLAI